MVKLVVNPYLYGKHKMNSGLLPISIVWVVVVDETQVIPLHLIASVYVFFRSLQPSTYGESDTDFLSFSTV